VDIADVRKNVLSAMAAARRRAADRRMRVERATKAYEALLDRTAVPLFRQVANVLRAEGHVFVLSTPAGAVRLAWERAPEDGIELLLDTSGDTPVVTGRVSRRRGSRIAQTEAALGDPESIGEDAVLAFLLGALEPFVER
jgi:hypothetical protein